MSGSNSRRGSETVAEEEEDLLQTFRPQGAQALQGSHLDTDVW